MAQLVLTIAGTAAGTAVAGPAGGAVGGALGGAIGGQIDAALFPGPTTRVSGPRLASTAVPLPAEGSHLPQLMGWGRLPARMIWRTPLVEEATTETQGGKGAPAAPRVSSTSYAYFGNAAWALCEGSPRLHFGRVWADGRKIDAAALGLRFYRGAADQLPDALVEALEGLGKWPAYRDAALVVAERLPLRPYGDRLPALHVEACNPIGDMEPLIRGLSVIPGNEWGLATTPIRQETLDGQDVVSATVENGHRSEVETDFTVSLRRWRELCPNLTSVELVLTWFGSDLRVGECEITPRTELAAKRTAPLAWSVDGITRGDALVVSLFEGRPKFGSTAADASVLEAIAAIKATGLRVLVYPFIQMDIPAGNGLPDPYGGAEQGAYPWRGRITSPNDGGAAVRAEVAAFFDRANGYRRFITHLAQLADDAGGVFAFVIGTEMRGLTWLRDDLGDYPAVTRLRQLAAEVRAILGAGCKIGYAADWSEYFGHQPGDGSGDVFFHLDPLWSDDEIDFVGIDNYMPLTDWRDGPEHADAAFGAPYARAYLEANVEGGEGFDWFYASDADRAAQLRTPITDGAAGEPWVFRYKDIRSWWSNAHHNRPAGVRDATPTAWVPMSKPIWFTEIGCGAVDKGGNQPNLFFDPASSESGLPYFSTGRRDDFMQRRFLEVALGYWTQPGRNPVSPVYGGPMIDVSMTHVWTEDNRPWPEFPDMGDVWADAPNYRGGHWVRLGRAPAAEAIRLRLAAEGFDPAELDLAACYGQADGVATDRAMSFREWLSPWQAALRLDVFESFGQLVFQSRVAAVPWGAVTPEDVAEGASASGYVLTRSSAEAPPAEIVVRFADSGADWQQGAARETLRVGVEDGLAEADVALGLDLERAEAVAAAWLRDVTEGREMLEFVAPPSWADLEVGRPITFAVAGRALPFMVEAVAEGAGRRVTARSFDQAALRGGLAGPPRTVARTVQAAPAPPLVAFMDLPQLTPTADPVAGYVAAHADPFLGVELHRAAAQGGPYELREALGVRTPLGRLAADLGPAASDRWTAGPAVVRLFAGELLTQAPEAVLSGAGALAVEAAPGVWEVLQYQRAELTGSREWTLRGLLRGRLGTEAAAAAGALEGARAGVLGFTLAQPRMGPADIGRAWWWRAVPAGRDPAGPLAAERQHAFTGAGLRPFAPWLLRAQGLGDGGAALSWLRRARQPGQPWATPPLGEEREAYRLRIRPAAGGAAVRELEVDAHAWTYSAAARAADGLGPAFTLEVAQLSAVTGPGASASAVLTV